MNPWAFLWLWTCVAAVVTAVVLIDEGDFKKSLAVGLAWPLVVVGLAIIGVLITVDWVANRGGKQ